MTTITTEQITARAAERAPVPDEERLLIPAATARWRDNYRFRLIYLWLATQQSWWFGSAKQVADMRQAADEKFPESGAGHVAGTGPVKEGCHHYREENHHDQQ